LAGHGAAVAERFNQLLCVMKTARTQLFAVLLLVAGLWLEAKPVAGQSLFENKNLTPRALGLGGAHLLAGPEPLAAIWNPASLAALREAQLSVNSNFDYRISGLGVSGFRPQTGGWGLALVRLPLGEHQVDRLGLAWGKSLSPFFALGLGVQGNRFVGMKKDDQATMTIGLSLHPLGGRVPVSYEHAAAQNFNAPVSPYRLALGLQAGDLFSKEKLIPAYYKASLALRTGKRLPSLFITQEWREHETETQLGLATVVFKHLALFSGAQNLQDPGLAFGATLMNENYAFDFVYSAKAERWLGGLSLRLGASPAVRMQRHSSAGKEFAKAKDYRAALHEFQQYRAYEPDHPKITELLAELATRVAAEDQRILGLMAEADSYERKREYISAALNYLQVLKLDRQHRAARLRMERLEPHLDIYANQLYRRGVQAFEDGNYEEANRAFENILLVRKSHPEAENYLARLAEFRRKQAEEDFLKGLGYYSQGNYQKARHAFEATLRLEPEHAEAQRYLEKTQAELELQKGRIEGMIARAQSFERRQQYLNAYKVYREVLSLDPNHETARRQIQALQTNLDTFVQQKVQAGASAFQRGDLERAEREFQAVLATSPNHREALSYRQRIQEQVRANLEELMRSGSRWLEAREWAKAADAFERVLAMDPSNKLASSKRNEALSVLGLKGQFERGEEHFRRGEFVLAMEMFDKVLSRDPENSRARKYLDDAQRQLNLKVDQYFSNGLSFYANEDYDKAIVEWRQALALNPKHAQSQEFIEKARLKLEALEKLSNP
jgi:tetratricopeptide (TPR) repeat protein